MRCGTGIEVGPVPLHPTTRQRWLDVLGTALEQDIPDAVEERTQQQLDELSERREVLRALQRALTLEAVTLAQDLDLTEVLTAEPDTVSSELRRLTTGVFADLTEADDEVDGIDAGGTPLRPGRRHPRLRTDGTGHPTDAALRSVGHARGLRRAARRRAGTAARAARNRHSAEHTTSTETPTSASGHAERGP